jgi:hypothetical protein
MTGATTGYDAIVIDGVAPLSTAAANLRPRLGKRQ